MPHDGFGRRGDRVAHARPKNPVPGHLVLQEFSQVGIVKGHGSVQHYEEDYPQRPNVGEFRVVRSAVDDFRSCIRRRTAVGLAEHPAALGVDAEAREAEVGEFYVEPAR